MDNDWYAVRTLLLQLRGMSIAYLFRDGRQRWPFRVDALVMLPDHLHAIWTLPLDDADYSKRWGTIKKHFTQSWLAAGGNEQPLSNSRHRYRRRGV